MLFSVGVILLLVSSSSVGHAGTGESDENYDDEGILVQVFHGGMQDELWTPSPGNWRRNSPPLSMVIWISVVLGIFALMVTAVCCAFFCKYSGMLSGNTGPDMLRSPIPIIITPPSETHTLSGESNLGYSNQGFRWGSVTPTPELPPRYMDLKVNSSSYSKVGEKLETPPPEYMTVAPFK